MITSAARSRAGIAPRRRPSLAVIRDVGTHHQIATGAILAALYLLALGAGQDRLAMGVIMAGAGTSLAWPAAGLGMFAVIMPMREPEILVPVRVDALLAGAITLGCILRLPVDRMPLRVHPGVVLLVGYVLVSALSIPPVLSGHPSAWLPSALNTLLRLVTGVALFLSATYLFRLMSPWPIVVLAMAGATLAALLALGDILGFLPLEALTRGLVEDVGSSRASGAFADPNFLGLYAATAAAFTLGVLAVAPRPLKVRLVPIALLLLTCVALSYSRAAYVGIAAGFVVLVALWNRKAALLVLVAIAVFGVTLYPAFLEARQGGPLSPIDAFDMGRSQTSRQAMLAAAVAMFAAFPVFGVGFGVFQFVSPSYVVVIAPDTGFSHNQYLNILAEQGLVGVIMVTVLVCVAGIALVRSDSPLRTAAIAMGATYLAVSLFLHTATSFQGSSLLWLVLAAAFATGLGRIDTTREV